MEQQPRTEKPIFPDDAEINPVKKPSLTSETKSVTSRAENVFAAFDNMCHQAERLEARYNRHLAIQRQSDQVDALFQQRGRWPAGLTLIFLTCMRNYGNSLRRIAESTGGDATLKELLRAYANTNAGPSLSATEKSPSVDVFQCHGLSPSDAGYLLRLGEFSGWFLRRRANALSPRRTSVSAMECRKLERAFQTAITDKRLLNVMFKIARHSTIVCQEV